MNIRFFYKPFIWLLIISYGLYLPAESLPRKPFINIPHFDKIVHFGLFFVLCLLLFRPLKQLRKNYLFWAPLISVIFGAVFELTQHLFSSSRNSNIYDFVANCTGIGISLVFYYFLVSNKKWEKYF